MGTNLEQGDIVVSKNEESLKKLDRSIEEREVPNQVTLAAMQESMEHAPRYNSVEELFQDLEKDDAEDLKDLEIS